MARSLQNELPEEATSSAIDDLVPGKCESGIYGKIPGMPHEKEYLAQRALLKMPHVHFSSLQVHRLEDGICLTGVVKILDQKEGSQFERVAARAAGVTQVLNRLVIQQNAAKSSE